MTETTKSITPGAGRGCAPNRCVPSKRLKAWHRASGSGLSLLAFARSIAKNNGLAAGAMDPRIKVAVAWLDGRR